MAEVRQEIEVWERTSSALDLLLGMVEAETLARHCRPSSIQAIPLVIVAGFLGAGKTTLVRHLITNSQGRKIAAVVNDFAALNIDETLIAEVSRDTIALENGCICCTLSGSVARTLLTIAERKDRPDAIIIEASGVADPSNVAQVASGLPGIALDCIVGVVDAATKPLAPEVDTFLMRQIECADIILLNKIDLISRVEADELAARIKNRVPRAAVLQTVDCKAPASFFFDNDHHAFASGRELEENDKPGFESAVIELAGSIDRSSFENCLSSMPHEVLRLKGFVSFIQEPETPYLAQAVGRRWRLQRVDQRTTERRMIAIGLRESSFSKVLKSHLGSFGLNKHILDSVAG